MQEMWLVGGDFNVILTEEEKQGGLPFTNAEAQDFATCIATCALTELKYKGRVVSHGGMGEYERNVFLRCLDGVMANQEFLELLPTSESYHLIRQGSNHAPLHIVCNSKEESVQRPFKFLNF